MNLTAFIPTINSEAFSIPFIKNQDWVVPPEIAFCLGIGVQIPMPSWGFMIEQHKGLIMNADKAYLALLPGLAIILLVFAFMTLGNGLRDAFDKRENTVKSYNNLKGAHLDQHI